MAKVYKRGSKQPKKKLVSVDLSLHERQAEVFTTEADEILYGGQAGGGKSHLARVLLIHYCASIKNLQAYLFRREFDDLIRTHVDGPGGFRVLLNPWIYGEKAFVQITEAEIRFWNGSKIHLCHCHEERDVYRYLSADIHVLIIDEATTFTDFMYRMLRSRVRVAGINKPEEFKQPLPRILLCSNPGGVGHGWVKSAFIDPKPPLTVWEAPETEGGMKRVFIPAGLDDNPSLDKRTYDLRLAGLPPELARAYREGRWDVIQGAYFPEFGPQHQLRPFAIPGHWMRFRSYDFGSYHPFSVGWYAVASEDTVAEESLAKKQVSIPKGSIVKYREWYGAESPDKGIDLVIQQVAAGILEREEANERITYSVADPAIFNQTGIGTSIAEEFARCGITFDQADNARLSGWQEMRRRLLGENGRPLLYFFDTCRDSIRCIPLMQHDPRRPEDLNSKLEDHVLDEIRYGLMSRPYSHPTPPPPMPRRQEVMTLNRLYELDKRDRMRNRRRFSF